VRTTPIEDLRAELNRRRAGEDAPVSLERSNDLRAELNRRRADEYARVSLERARERRQNVEGRNLDYDFAAVAPCSIPKIQILEFSQTRSKFKMNFKFHFKMFVCELISTNKV
jgi:hypothetical protein